MAAPEQSKNRRYEEKDEDLWEIGESESDPEYDSDESMKDPTYSILEETHAKFSNLSIKGKSKARIVKDNDVGSEAEVDGQEVVVPELDEKDRQSFENVQKIIEARQIEKLKVEQCKLYLRKNGLRLTGNKDTLILRIKEHLEILNGGGEKKYPASTFVLNCKGDACTGDVVMFEQHVYEMFDIASRSGKGPPCGTRIVAGRIVKESYGAAKQQHTFTIEVLWSKGEKPLPPLHPLLIKGRNLYRLKTLRQKWEDEGERQKVLMEKHSRGSLARSDREARVQEKEMRKVLKTNRVSRKGGPKKNESQLNSTSVLKSSHQPQQSVSFVNSANLHQPVGISVGSGNMKAGAQQLGLFSHSSKPATQPHQSESTAYSQKPAPGPPAISSGFFVDSRKVTFQPQLRRNTTMQDRYFNQASQNLDTSTNPNNIQRVYNRTGEALVNIYDNKSNAHTVQGISFQGHQRQPLASVNHFLPTSPRGQKLMCRHYAQGRCYYGERRKFSHENEVREERWSQQQSYYGERCKFSHENEVREERWSQLQSYYGERCKFSHENEVREERWSPQQSYYGERCKFSHENEVREERWPPQQRNFELSWRQRQIFHENEVREERWSPQQSYYGKRCKFSHENEVREERWPPQQRNFELSWRQRQIFQ
ncbi:zinc finger CCCH domain-containing protein 62-like isoform X6 [Malus sylvestris]|uniref:zinc finger CCCH domain-containing protein 62-like isoform X6 n=1 Tax=Malus sylvestris TaxID=3752 RepID=UPI0021ACDFA6|nr:zinc finger CCCH domain-containing protein 62-like isoform X6 [Malus sylvestris]